MYRTLFLSLMFIFSLQPLFCAKNEEDYGDDHTVFVFVSSHPNMTMENTVYRRNIKDTTSNISTTTAVTQTPRFRVVGGKAAVLGEVPWQVALKMGVPVRYARYWNRKKPQKKEYKYRTFCGGSIIGRAKVLTAAHCFEQFMSRSPLCGKGKIEGKKLRRVYAVAGTLVSDSRLYQDGGQWRRIVSGHHPPRYKFPNNDVCVLILSKKFDYNPNVHSVIMQKSYEDMYGSCLTSGFGGINSAHSKKVKSSPILLTAYLQLMRTSECRRYHSQKVVKKFVCTVSGRPDVSKGDSGGPLVCIDTLKQEPRLVGITCGTTHYMYQGGSTDTVTYFTRVSAFQRFIKKSGADALKHSKIVLILASVFLLNTQLFL